MEISGNLNISESLVAFFGLALAYGFIGLCVQKTFSDLRVLITYVIKLLKFSYNRIKFFICN